MADNTLHILIPGTNIPPAPSQVGQIGGTGSGANNPYQGSPLLEHGTGHQIFLPPHITQGKGHHNEDEQSGCRGEQPW